MTRTLKIDLFSDPACPWCLLGLTRLDIAIAKLPDDVSVTVEHHPFLLDADAPEEGQNVVEMLTEKYGREPFDMWDRLEAEAQRSGLVLDMRKQANRYPTQKAQVLIKMAQSVGRQHEVAVALSHAYYLDALNVADPEVLVKIGAEYGLDTDAVRAAVTSEQACKVIEQEAANAAEQGVSGVPFFIFQQKYALSGAQPQEVFTEAFDTVLAETAA